MLYENSRRWRVLAKHYAKHERQAIEQQSWQSGVLLSTVGFNALNGVLTFGVA